MNWKAELKRFFREADLDSNPAVIDLSPDDYVVHGTHKMLDRPKGMCYTESMGERV